MAALPNQYTLLLFARQLLFDRRRSIFQTCGDLLLPSASASAVIAGCRPSQCRCMPGYNACIANVRMKDAAPPNVIPLRDGLTNGLTGAGTTTDPQSYNRNAARHFASFEVDQAYRGGPGTRKIVDKPAREMVREWRNWQASPDEVSALETAECVLGIRQKAEKALRYAALGGGAMVLYVEGEQAEPLNPAAIRTGSLKQVHVWHRSMLALEPMLTEWGDPWFGHPEYYEARLVQGFNVSAPVRFHLSRVIAFKGHALPLMSQAGWEDEAAVDSQGVVRQFASKPFLFPALGLAIAFLPCLAHSIRGSYRVEKRIDSFMASRNRSPWRRCAA